MNGLTKFTVLIERRALRKALTLLTSIAMVFGVLTPRYAFAVPGNGQARKVARDLQAALDASITPNATWAKDINGVRHVQVVIMSSSSDTQMSTLRDGVSRA